jgi:beta-lactamase superfamily II metal-dependent hydrolase
MLEVSNITFQKFGIPKENSFYFLPEELIKETEWIPVEDDAEFGANYLAFTARYKSKPIKFSKAVTYQNFISSIDVENDNSFNKIAVPFFKAIRPNKVNVTVFDVGQGNWNEINFDNKTLICYDFGSSSSHKLSHLIQNHVRPQVLGMRINSILDEKKLRKILIISHWDVDHYIGLQSLTDIQLKSFKFCIVPNRIENETTARIVEKLKRNTKVIPIEMNSRIQGVSSSRLTVEYNSDILKLFKGTKCRDRNKRGILLSLHFNHQDFVFPGDHHYNQIENYVMNYCCNKEYNLVIPHHGGNAGNYRLLNNIRNGSNAIISAGGRYGHPFRHILDQAQSNFANLRRTDYDGTVSLCL